MREWIIRNRMLRYCVMMLIWGGALVLLYSLKKTGTTVPITTICSKNVSKDSIKKLERLSDVIVMDDIPVTSAIIEDNNDGFEKWNTTFFKLNVVALTQFKKIVVLDADMVVYRNIDCLFDMPHMSCVPAGKIVSKQENYGLNSGLMVIEPSRSLYEKLKEAIPAMKKEKSSCPVGDQDVFKYMYPNWTSNKQLELPELFNCYSTEVDELVEQHSFKFEDVYIIHHAMIKPWLVNWKYPVQMIHSQIVNHKNLHCFYQLKTYFDWKKIYRHVRREL